MKQAAITLIAVAMTGCPLPTSPEEVPEWLRVEWRIGQENVARLKTRLVEGSPFSVQPEQFEFVQVNGVFQCGDVAGTSGCTSVGGVIRYNINAPTVIRHEAGHAILHALGDPRWRMFEHMEWCKMEKEYWCQ